jgi:alpha-galactosidase
MDERIVLIGAGSAVFTAGLIADLIRLGEPVDAALVDPNPAALNIALRLAQKMASAAHAPLHLRAALDRRDVLPGATAVICTVGVGGRRAWEQDVFIPRRYGIYAPVGDTVGPGGSSRALRMIPAMATIARDVLDLAPDALFFNYGNPMAPICRAIRKATGAPVVGLCHGVMETARYLARALDAPVGDLQYIATGINHLTWFTHVQVGEQDAMPRLRAIAAERAARPPEPLPVGDSPYESPEDNPFAWRLMHWFGAFPAVLDRHVTEFFPQFFRDGAYWHKRLGVDAFSFEGTIADGDRTFAEMSAVALSDDPLPDSYLARFGGEHEQVMDIIRAVRTNAGLVVSANLPNHGQTPSLPHDAIVEGPALVDGYGVRALQQPTLPAAIAGTLATRCQWVETIVEAALEQSREKFVQALALDGAVSSIDQAVALADELLAAQSSYLGWGSA